MKFNIKIERVRRRWFHRNENQIEKIRRNIDDMFTKWNEEMEKQHVEFTRMLDQIQKTK